MLKTLLATLAMLFSAVQLFGSSFYTARLDDARAVYLTADKFPVMRTGTRKAGDGTSARRVPKNSEKLQRIEAPSQNRRGFFP